MLRLRLLRTTLLAGALLPVLGLTVAACEGGIEPEAEEPLASGLRISAEGSVLATASGPAASETLRVAPGAETTLEVTFLDARGAPVTPAPDLSLDADVHLSSVATLRVGAPSAFTATLRGLGQGATTARFTLLEDGRPAYISPPVEVAVGPPGS